MIRKDFDSATNLANARYTSGPFKPGKSAAIPRNKRKAPAELPAYFGASDLPSDTVAKNSGPPAPQSPGELKAAKGLNTLALVGAGHAIVTSAKDVPGVSRLIPTGVKNVAAKLPKVPPAAAGAVAGGWVAYHAAEGVGDIMARRSIRNQIAQQQGPTVVKSLTQLAQDSRGAVAKSLHRRVLTPESVTKAAPRSGLVQPTVVQVAKNFGSGGQGGRSLIATTPVMKALGEDAMKTAAKKGKRILDLRTPPTGQGLQGKLDLQRTHVRKRYFDPEADRQRRLGLYAGLGGGAALVTGNAARHTLEVPKDEVKVGRAYIRTPVGLRFKAGKAGRGALLAAATAAAAGGGAMAYKRGIDARNQPWN